eukprot:2413338-Rhodomonas_salina.1
MSSEHAENNCTILRSWSEKLLVLPKQALCFEIADGARENLLLVLAKLKFSVDDSPEGARESLLLALPKRTLSVDEPLDDAFETLLL